MSFTIPSGLYGTIKGPIIIIGFGSIGKGVLPLIERHFKYDKMIVIDPNDKDKKLLNEKNIEFIHIGLTKNNYSEVLRPILQENAFCVNLSVDTSSLDIMKLCREHSAFYIDTVVEPWAGHYFDTSLSNAARTNYSLREGILAEKRRAGLEGITAISCCGANPGMVSWFVKKALMDLATDLKIPHTKPTNKNEWATLMQTVGVKGIHIAERDTQVSKKTKPMGTFVNTWSVEGFMSEGMQPAELGFGTHEKWKPENAEFHAEGCQSAIYLQQPGANTKVRSWCPTPGAQFGRLVTHNESISIADYFTVGEGINPKYRPTCHYAYHPANDAILSLDEMFGKSLSKMEEQHILDENEIVSGIDELGVLLYGHDKNAYWYGSQLSIEETRAIAPMQNATGLQVTSAVIAGMAWALENPMAGIIEADEMDYERCLEFQMPYLGPVKGYYTDWNPLTNRPGFFPEDIDTTDPWQFKNIIVK